MMDILIWPITMPFTDKAKWRDGCESHRLVDRATVLWTFFLFLFKCQVQLVDAWKEKLGSHTEGHASQHPSLSLFPPRRPRARASGCVAMATKWGKWLQENPYHDHHPHRPLFSGTLTQYVQVFLACYSPSNVAIPAWNLKYLHKLFVR